MRCRLSYRTRRREGISDSGFLVGQAPVVARSGDRATTADSELVGVNRQVGKLAATDRSHAAAQAALLPLADQPAAVFRRLFVQLEQVVRVGARQFLAAAAHGGGGEGEELAQVRALLQRP